MERILSKPEYEEMLAQSRDKRMEWWREARFGMFIHFGLYSVIQRHEWAMALENFPVEEYEKLADQFCPKEGAPREWARLAAEAGMKYMVMTTRHHEGFSLWDSKVNPYNSVNYGPHRDIVREFVDACREYGLRIGFYSSLMDWHHPDCGRSAYDIKARERFNNYIYELNRELLTQYGKIDILWYDVAAPMEHAEGWNSLERNQILRQIQPDIIINNRSLLDEDFETPEEHIRVAKDRDWEACMTFNGLSWGYIDSNQAAPYSYNAQRILRMLATVTAGGGNLLLNIGPTPDGSVPAEAIKPLKTVGCWLIANREAVYGKVDRCQSMWTNPLCTITRKGNVLYCWNWIWPNNGQLVLGGFFTRLKSARLLGVGQEIKFEQDKYRIILKNLPEKSPDQVAGVAVFALEFEESPRFAGASAYPALNKGRVY
ncbi:MAG: alpha-L-fucosidase [Clostridiaceae bacterium]|nr:alpha-L-fucosidase [Clostridiaceae bacterium]